MVTVGQFTLTRSGSRSTDATISWGQEIVGSRVMSPLTELTIRVEFKDIDESGARSEDTTVVIVGQFPSTRSG